MKTDSTQAAKEKLDCAVVILLNPITPEDHYKSKSFLSYIGRLLRQNKMFHLEVQEVFPELYLRAVNYVHKNNAEINNPNAFLKRVAVYYINELIRKKMKYLSYEPNILDDQIDPSQTKEESYFERFNQNDLKRFYSLLEKLSWSDKEILRLWKIEDYKWKNIATELEKHGEYLSLDSAKKRGERLMKRMRKEMKY